MRNERLLDTLISIFGLQYEVRNDQFRIDCINPNCRDINGNLEISLENGVFHCLGGDTEIITHDGIKRIKDVAGKIVKLLTKDGKWVDAPVLYFGKQIVDKIVLKRNRKEKIIYATSGHRWFVRKYSIPIDMESDNILELTTSRLKIGKKLIRNPLKKLFLDFTSTDVNYWIARGFVFGDGTKNKKQKRTIAYFCGEKDKSMMKYFSEFHSKIWFNEKANRYQKGSLPQDFKELPIKDSTPEELYCWLQGYFAADGCVRKGGYVELSSSKKRNLEYVKDICIKLGIDTFEITTYKRKGYGKQLSNMYALILGNLDRDFFLLLHHYNRYSLREKFYSRMGWKVKSIERRVKRQKVYCAVVPDTHSFTLDGNILTGNCWLCEYSGRVTKLLMDHMGWGDFKIEEYIPASAMVLKDIHKEEEAPVKKIINDEVLPKEFLPLWTSELTTIGKKAYAYIRDRVDEQNIELYRIGYCGTGKYKNRIIVPTIEDDKVVYFVGRTFTDENPKYRNPDKKDLGEGKDNYIFNLNNARNQNQIVVCEGVFDAIAVGLEGVAIFGTHLSEIQLRKIARTKKPVSVCLDKDAYEKSRILAQELREEIKDVKIVKIQEKDPGVTNRLILKDLVDLAPKFSRKDIVKPQ